MTTSPTNPHPTTEQDRESSNYAISIFRLEKQKEISVSTFSPFPSRFIYLRRGFLIPSINSHHVVFVVVTSRQTIQRQLSPISTTRKTVEEEEKKKHDTNSGRQPTGVASLA